MSRASTSLLWTQQAAGWLPIAEPRLSPYRQRMLCSAPSLTLQISACLGRAATGCHITHRLGVLVPGVRLGIVDVNDEQVLVLVLLLAPRHTVALQNGAGKGSVWEGCWHACCMLRACLALGSTHTQLATLPLPLLSPLLPFALTWCTSVSITMTRRTKPPDAARRRRAAK